MAATIAAPAGTDSPFASPTRHPEAFFVAERLVLPVGIRGEQHCALAMSIRLRMATRRARTARQLASLSSVTRYTRQMNAVRGACFPVVVPLDVDDDATDIALRFAGHEREPCTSRRVAPCGNLR